MIKDSLQKNWGRTPLAVRKSGFVLTLGGIGVLLVGLMFVHAHLQRRADLPLIEAVAGVVAELELTDLALFTEARYTRHPSQADLHSAFQDHPTALEHFPTGSLVRPPVHLIKQRKTIDE